ncbi:asparaginase [Jiangella alkaliphila]|uniref:L-asparaginase II n=1 Tax=Jiangella alkaliphila TaxID=419479 RepID=A0A1H2FUD1_9ACTN|nr:asparaginase [Jiangella alkaliphila]SDU10963.1 L-asparaginase II [Jiangella alkaliphila]
MHAGDAVLVAEVVRSGLVESRHRGSVVALAADGSVAFTAGQVDAPMYPRSSNKPAQAAAMLRLGLPLDGELLALAAASHSGEPLHVDGVRRILALGGLEESALRNTPGYPIDHTTMADYVRKGGEPSSLTADCSGKHAAMLLTCVVNSWPTDGYLDPAHPLQVAIRDTVGSLAGAPVAHTGVDGCGAPLFAVPLTGLARMFRSLALAPSGTPDRRVVEAIQAHPEYTSGTTRDEAQLIRGLPGLFAKGGAESVLAAALDDGRAVALKIDDGGYRARMPVLVAALRRLGVDAPVLDELASAPVLGGGHPVGEIRAAIDWPA